MYFFPMVSSDTLKEPPLFQEYTGLRSLLPHLSLGCFPTPVERLAAQGGDTGAIDLFVKNDGVSGKVYGGNKVRKLEFLLADALHRKARRVITCGAAGSNHALATAIYAAQAGLKATLVLFDQPVSGMVRDNLLMDAHAGAELVYEERYTDLDERFRRLTAQYENLEGSSPYCIPAGGSSEIGTIGYVNAAFELRDQIAAERLAPPEAIYVAFGTMGTVAGLAVGLMAAGVASRLVAVRVVPHQVANIGLLAELCRRTNEMLIQADSSFPRIGDLTKIVTVVDDYFAPGYGLASPVVEQSVRLAAERYSLDLDHTYSGKAFTAFHEAAQTGRGYGPLLFWNTKNARALPASVVEGDYSILPQPFHRYFSGNRGSGDPEHSEGHDRR